jgi:hypothetical protein
MAKSVFGSNTDPDGGYNAVENFNINTAPLMEYLLVRAAGSL